MPWNGSEFTIFLSCKHGFVDKNTQLTYVKLTEIKHLSIPWSEETKAAQFDVFNPLRIEDTFSDCFSLLLIYLAYPLKNTIFVKSKREKGTKKESLKESLAS